VNEFEKYSVKRRIDQWHSDAFGRVSSGRTPGEIYIIEIENDLLLIVVLVHCYPLLFHSSYLRFYIRRS